MLHNVNIVITLCVNIVRVQLYGCSIQYGDDTTCDCIAMNDDICFEVETKQ